MDNQQLNQLTQAIQSLLSKGQRVGQRFIEGNPLPVSEMPDSVYKTFGMQKNPVAQLINASSSIPGLRNVQAGMQELTGNKPDLTKPMSDPQISWGVDVGVRPKIVPTRVSAALKNLGQSPTLEGEVLKSTVNRLGGGQIIKQEPPKFLFQPIKGSMGGSKKVLPEKAGLGETSKFASTQQYIKDITRDKNYQITLKVSGGDENRAIARILEQRLAEGKVPKDIMEKIYANTPNVRDMETGELLDAFKNFRGEHARQLMEKLEIELPQSPVTQPTTFYESLKKSAKSTNLYSETGLPAGNTFDLGNGIKAELTAREHLPDGRVLENNTSGAKTWYLERISSTDKGKGNATKALDNLLKQADDYGITLKVEPKPYGKIQGLNADQLKAWYQKRGFVPDEGIYWKREPSGVKPF